MASTESSVAEKNLSAKPLILGEELARFLLLLQVELNAENPGSPPTTPRKLLSRGRITHLILSSQLLSESLMSVAK